MFLKLLRRFVRASGTAGLLAVAGAMMLIPPASAAGPIIVSVVPTTGAVGVSASAPVVFTFSAAMDATATIASFFDTNGATLTTSASWSADGETLTCAPSPAFPSPDEIIWTVNGQDTMGNSLQGQTTGVFSIGGSSGGGGGNPCDNTANTNTSFTINESWLFDQTSASPPTPDPTTPYAVIAEVVLISNLNATAASLTFPDGSMTNLQSLGFSGETFLTFDNETSASALNAAWPNGTYTFNVTGASLPPVTVAWNIAQPNTPQVANFAAAQAVDSTKPFTLTWNAFTGRVATNEIFLNIGYDPCAGTGFSTILPGTATSLTIPAGALQPGSNYVKSTLGFINAAGTVNASPKYSAGGSHSSVTSFTLTTIGGGGSGSVSVSNPVLSGGMLTFAVTASPNTTVTVETSSTLQAGSWTPLLTTNSGPGTVTVTDTPSLTLPALFYRAHQ